jgi:hypothetical protein
MTFYKKGDDLMWKHIIRHGGGTLMVGLVLLCLVVKAQEPQNTTRSANVKLAELKPQWKSGDKWVVETSSLLLQAREGTNQPARSKPIQWQFAVQRFDKSVGDDCYRVEIRCLLPGRPQPVTVLWVDKAKHTLRQITTQVPVRGGFVTLTENYEFNNGQPSPVLGPLTAIPVDFPLFAANQTKGLEKFSYVANVGPSGAKALGDVGFSFDVEQDAQIVQPEQAKGLLNDDFSKDLAARPAIEVKLKQIDRTVRQVWQAGLPWPAYSDDGKTISRLINVTRNNTSNASEQ